MPCTAERGQAVTLSSGGAWYTWGEPLRTLHTTVFATHHIAWSFCDSHSSVFAERMRGKNSY